MPEQFYSDKVFVSKDDYKKYGYTEESIIRSWEFRDHNIFTFRDKKDERAYEYQYHGDLKDDWRFEGCFIEGTDKNSDRYILAGYPVDSQKKRTKRAMSVCAVVRELLYKIEAAPEEFYLDHTEPQKKTLKTGGQEGKENKGGEKEDKKALKILRFVAIKKEKKKEGGEKEEKAGEIPSGADSEISLAAGETATFYWEVEGEVAKVKFDPFGEDVEKTLVGDGAVSWYDVTYGKSEGEQELPKEFTLTLTPKGGGEPVTAKVNVVDSLKEKLDEHKEFFELMSLIKMPNELFKAIREQLKAANALRGGVSKVLSGKGVLIQFFNSGIGSATFAFFEENKEEIKEFCEKAETVADLLDLLINIIEFGSATKEWWEGEKPGKDAVIAALKAMDSLIKNVAKNNTAKRAMRKPLIKLLGQGAAKKLPGLADKAMDFVEAVPITLDVIEDWWTGNKPKLWKDLPKCAVALGPPAVGALVEQATQSESAGKLAKFLAEKAAKYLDELGDAAVAAAEGAFESEARAITADAEWKQMTLDHAMSIGLDQNEALKIRNLYCNLGGERTRRLISAELWNLKSPGTVGLREYSKDLDAIDAWMRSMPARAKAPYAPVAQVFDEMAGLPPKDGVAGKLLDWLTTGKYAATNEARDAVLAQYPGWRFAAGNAQMACKALSEKAAGMALDFYKAFNEDQGFVLQVVPE